MARVSVVDLQTAATAGPLELPPLPCHTQAVERYVQEVTVAVKKVVGEERRDGLIRTKVAARKRMPKFNTKAAFKASRQAGAYWPGGDGGEIPPGPPRYAGPFWIQRHKVLCS